MAQNGYGTAPVGNIGRIPNFGRTQVNPMGNHEPPACVQNAMMTKDKKPFTYTPGGLDLSQIKTPSMARRLARQRSLEEQEQAYQQPTNNGGYRPQGGPNNYGSGGPAPPPPPPMNIPAPPPPPPIVIQVPDSKSPKPVALGERPEIVIPENPIGMLRKTNSPYHWESEKDQHQRMGPVPKFVEKVPSPLTVKMPPSSFSQQQPQTYTPQGQYNQRLPESPIHRPEAQYSHPASPLANGSPPTREMLVRQDSQFNKSPQPFSGQSPANNSPFSPSPNNNWRQPEKRDSPIITSPQSPPQNNRGQFSPNLQYSPNVKQISSNTQQYSPNTQQFSPSSQQHSPITQQYSPNYQNQVPATNSGPAFHTLPRVQRTPEVPQNTNTIYNNTNQIQTSPADVAPWRTQTLNRYPKEPDNQTKNAPYTPQWKSNEPDNNENVYIPPWQVQQENKNQSLQGRVSDTNNNKVQEAQSPWRPQNNSAPSPPQYQPQPEQRYQSTMSIPVTPRKQPQSDHSAPQKEAVYVNQEPVYFCPESPKSIPPWVKTQKEKTKTPPPEWVQRPLESRKSLPRDLVTPTRESEPEWVKKSNEIQRGAREVVSPPKYQQPQPSWSTRPSENRKSLPRDGASPPSRVVPIQMEVSSTEKHDRQGGQPQPQLRITIGMNPRMNPAQDARAPFSPPTQRIMRVLSPQLVRTDEPQHELPTLNRNLQSDSQPKTRIIPIQIEGGNGGANKSFGGRY